MRKKYYLLLLLIVWIITQPASAYIDPSVGSILWQAVIGILLAGTVYIKLKWSQIKSHFEKHSEEQNK